MHADWLRPEWTLPGVRAVMTTRHGGQSAAPWDRMNLGTAVGDDPADVACNRALLQQALGARPVYMKQVHGTRVLRLQARHAVEAAPIEEADACVTTEPGLACTVQVADCLPVLFAASGAVGAAHAGWRGLASGVVEATLRAVCEAATCEPADVHVWLGACIGSEKFEVGADVLQGFGVQPDTADAQRFKPLIPGKWLANLPLLATDRLMAAGVRHVSSAGCCTVTERLRFFSFRRDGVTGRMVAAIWLAG